MNTLFRKNRGFTLIELLTAITILAVLAAIVIASLSSAREKARDARRLSDLKQIELALQVYFDQHAGFPKEEDGYSGSGLGEICKSCGGPINDELEKLLGEVPEDPLYGDGDHTYYYDGWHVCTGLPYEVAVVFARTMENPQNANFMDTACADSGDDGFGSEGRDSGTESYNIILGPTSG